MLPPDARSLLLEALRPPAGSTLSRAVATTFTLDLESLLIAPLAFAAHAARDSADPIAVLDSVRRCADRIDVFCQAGHMTVPSIRSSLVAFVERMVHPVGRPRPGRLFHPKLWLLRFDDAETGTASLRLLVLSRNLTADRSWDTCLRLDGVIGSRPIAANRPLFDLIQQAAGLATNPIDPSRRAAIDALCEDVHRAEWEYPEDVTDVAFHAMGLSRSTVPDFSGTRHLVVSPFCTEGGLKQCAPGQKTTVVGRQEELDRLPDGALDGMDVMVMDELAGLSTEDGGDLLTGLHAKLYIVDYAQQARVFVGSANATDAAYGGNVELLVELAGSRNRLGIDTMVGDAAPFKTLLEPYERREPLDNDADQALTDLLRDIAAIPLTAAVSGSYVEHVTSSDPMPVLDGVRVTAQLYTRRGVALTLTGGQPVDAQFGGLPLLDVTPFVVITADDAKGNRQKTVVLARMIGDPADRLDHVLAHQIDTPEKFMRFLMLLLGLGDDPVAAMGAEKGGGAGMWLARSGSGVLELLLTALADRPAQIDDLGRLIERLQATEQGRSLMPPGFPELWATVKEARRRVLA
ncbi:phospholipase D family protein [Virgisporangium aurantiacum]|uniref:PLD phosphodiesterase domain-containing protein n=1 Tax=Virgisporangium aurantiacum TaxID=175570 RepID=A0A8J4DYX6_9ACTN|nr:phospholipase D family protein [Virgisporangium aurantiacum]GIJ56095.1 hypothetical protein Vau01_036110 [Virgisporangium aurantiacum]